MILPELPPSSAEPHSHRLQAALWIAAGLAVLALLYALSPILTPFLLAGILAYVCNPVTDRLAGLGLPRMLAVVLVLLALAALSAGLVLIVLPLLYEEATVLAARTPEAMALANEKLLPWLRQNFGIRLKLDAASLQKLAAGNWDTVQVILERLYSSLKIGGVALVGVLVNLLLTPVVMFYLLLDWHGMLARFSGIVPRPWHDKLRHIAADIDAVLSQYLRGQILVMAILAAYYCVALWLADIPSAFSIGVVTGLLIFIPYLGYATGLILALLVAALQFAGWGPIVAVLVVYGIGQVLESFVLTPFLVGERIGLHPLAVIFALMAFGQLFGFVGVLAALPASAALLVGLREVRGLYLASRFYRGG
ncbi:AI-2E family transporter [Sulfuritalea sp.]|uniref:AI-2E family transporter n=1 Tax=Sulfuritalea sp. TaxID=2480090 RepID=UPI001AC73298|nr:AI-2E family transporter [Sulfuritalea sp.]MBN8476977.1 AI-2E family transporter [Sulfuritalea sp.]